MQACARTACKVNEKFMHGIAVWGVCEYNNSNVILNKDFNLLKINKYYYY